MEFRILGSLEVVEDDTRIPIRAGNDRALLALLLLHANETVSSERLVDGLWGEDAPPSAPKIVQNAVLRLRRALGGDRLETRDHGYRLRVERDELDVACFERLLAGGGARDALALWRGPPLSELGDYAFAGDAARRLEELRLVALERRIDEDLAGGGAPGLVAELEHLAAAHPFRERFHAQLMRALYAEGRQAEALAAYRRARRTLSAELGLEPGPELQELERAILTQDPSLPRALPPQRAERARRRRWWIVLVVALAVTGGAVAAYLATRSDSPIVPPPNSVAVIDAAKGRIVAAIPVGAHPGSVAAGPSGVWVTNIADGTVTRIDSHRLVVAKTYGVDGAADVALDERGAWVVTGQNHTLVRIDARHGVGPTLTLPATPAGSYSVAVGGGAVWVGAGTVLKIDPHGPTILGKAEGDCCSPLDVEYAYGAAWVAEWGENVTKLGATSLRRVTSQPIGELEVRLARGYGAVWAAGVTTIGGRVPSVVWKLDPVTALPEAGFPVGHWTPSHFIHWTNSIAVGAGGVWVAPSNNRFLMRIDPDTGRVTATIPLGRPPAGLAIADGKVWVTLR